jgi:preprotein translocase SecE subunit
MAHNSGMTRRIGRGAVRRALNIGAAGDVVSELRRVTWPTRHETTRLTLMVIAVAAVIGAFLGLFDLAFARLFEAVLGN